MSFNRLIDILKNQTRFPSFTKRLQEAEALGRWEIAVGEIIAKHSRAIRVEDHVLWVEVDHPIWRSELHHRKRQILDILNKGIPVEEGPGVIGADLDRKTTGRKVPVQKKAKLAPATEILSDILFLDPRKGPPMKKPANPKGSKKEPVSN